jgi:5'-AMP-activated protein kinase catalytic alpha subunit
LGRFYHANSKIDTACGSPCYAPPEMLSKFKYEPIKADIWSLGIVLYAMLSGFLPFDDDDTEKLYKKIIDGKFSVPDFVSTEARDLLNGIINKNPNKRMNLPQIKQHPWYLKHLKLSKS